MMTIKSKWRKLDAGGRSPFAILGVIPFVAKSQTACLWSETLFRSKSLASNCLCNPGSFAANGSYVVLFPPVLQIRGKANEWMQAQVPEELVPRHTARPTEAAVGVFLLIMLQRGSLTPTVTIRRNGRYSRPSRGWRRQRLIAMDG
jgi:hypothetical protein